MGTIRELYADSIMHEIPFVAYGIFLLAQRDLINWDLEETELNFDHLTFEEINEAIKQNVLNFNTIHLYAAKIDGTTFAYILANSLQDANNEFYRVHRQKPVFLIEADGRMDRSMYDEGTKQILSFREVRNQTQTFPHYVCNYEDKELSYKEVESEYFRRRRQAGHHETPFSERPINELEELK